MRLDDGRHVRLLGINTPEIGHHGRPSQTLAVQARKALAGLLADGHDRVGLAYDREHFDRYHRTLAYMYVDGGRSVEAWLLARGLATVLIVPPNVSQASCYGSVERLARAEQRGLWHYARYHATPVERLSARSRGYHVVRGRITRIDRSRRAVWLHMDDALTVRVAKRDLPFLRPVAVDDLLHREVIVRGWLHRRRDGPGLFMQVRHRSELAPVAAGGGAGF